jgi:hypothetical protein
MLGGAARHRTGCQFGRRRPHQQAHRCATRAADPAGDYIE